MEYKFTINDFEGPLDLLLHLIKESNINIPLFYELNDKLKLYGLTSDNVTTIEEMVDELCN